MRRRIVRAVRSGSSQREVARRFHVSLSTVQRWVARAGDQRLDRIDFSAKPRGGARLHTDAGMEREVLALRRELAQRSDLGECGARAIRRALVECGHDSPPCERTIGRILARHGVLDGRRRLRRKAPPRAWHLTIAAQGLAEVDSLDIVEGLRIKDGPFVEVLNVVSLFGGLVESWPMEQAVRSTSVVDSLLAHWRKHGLPAYAHFDNDTIFQGAHQFPDTLGRVARLCLALGVIPVFAPPAEQGFQNAIEGYNARWQAKVWARFHHRSIGALCKRSARYVTAVNNARSARREAAPTRRKMPRNFRLDLARRLHGEVIFIRRTNEKGIASVLGHDFIADRHWQHRLVRATVDLDDEKIDFHALLRREPDCQPLLSSHPYKFPDRPFQG